MNQSCPQGYGSSVYTVYIPNSYDATVPYNVNEGYPYVKYTLLRSSSWLMVGIKLVNKHNNM